MKIKLLKTKFLFGGVVATGVAALLGGRLHPILTVLSDSGEFWTLLALILLVLVFPLWLGLNRWVFQPLTSLIQANLKSAIIPEEAIPEDEIGAVMRSRNTMLESLHQKQQRLEEEATRRARLAEELKGLNTGLEERIRQRTRELQVLYELSQEIGYSLDYDELFGLILGHVYRIVPYDVAAVLLVTETQEVFLRPIRPLTPDLKRELNTRLLTHLGQLSRRQVRADQLKVRALEVENNTSSHPPLESIGSFFQAPLTVQRQIVGLLFIGTEQPGQLTEEQIRFLHTVANETSTSIQRLQGLLATEKQRLEKLVAGLPEGLVLLNGEQRIILANPVAQSHLPALTQATVGEVMTHLGKQPMEQFFVPRPGGLPYEVVVTGSSRQIFEVQTHPIAEGPEAGGRVLLIRQVTEEREAQTKLAQQDRLAAVGQLAAGIAHDFNNLLTVVIGYAELLQKRADMPKSAKNPLQAIYNQGQRGAQLIRQILDFSRQSITQQHPLDLVPLLKETIKLLNHTLPESIHLLLEVETKGYRVKADVTQIQQVLTNLAVNARDAMPDGGTLCFQLSRLGPAPDGRLPLPKMAVREWLVLRVRDTGVGMPPEVLEHIFEPFFTTKDPGQGTGLGLAQVHGIVMQHDGHIEVESRVGEGTTFTIYLPALVGKKNESGQRTVREEVANGQGETILVVEDETLVVEALRTMLEYLNYQVLWASNGQDALTVYQMHREEIALVLTDMVMPEMGGIELFQTLREQDPEVKVIVLTGYPLGDDFHAIKDGIMDWLQKPPQLQELAQTVSQALYEAPWQQLRGYYRQPPTKPDRYHSEGVLRLRSG